MRLTEAGEKDFAERALVHEGWVSELFSDLSASDADGLIRILRTISHHNEAPHD